MKRDIGRNIKKISEFAEIDLDDDLMAITQKHSSFSFMTGFKDRFDDWVADFARAYLRIDINSVSFKNYQSEHSIDDLPQVKIVGAIPQVKSLSNTIPMDKIFKYK